MGMNQLDQPWFIALAGLVGLGTSARGAVDGGPWWLDASLEMLRGWLIFWWFCLLAGWLMVGCMTTGFVFTTFYDYCLLVSGCKMSEDLLNGWLMVIKGCKSQGQLKNKQQLEIVGGYANVVACCSTIKVWLAVAVCQPSCFFWGEYLWFIWSLVKLCIVIAGYIFTES